MAKLTLSEFLNNRNLLAIKISSGDLAGFFRKSLTIPLNTTGLAIFPDGTFGLFQEGEEVSGRFDLVLAKRGEVSLRLTFPDLKTSDGLPLSVTADLALELATHRLEFFRDFCRALFTFPGTFDLQDLKAHVGAEARRVLAAQVLGLPVAQLHRADRVGSIAPVLQESLERYLFDAGVRYGRLQDLTLVSSEYEQRAASEKRREDEKRRAADVMDRKEERLRRLAGILKDQDVQGVLNRVPDEKLKGLLYAKLMEDDAVQITAEELVSKAKDCGQEVVQVIYKAMENLLSNGASVSPEEVESAKADRIYAAAGTRVFELAPEGDDPPRVYTFRDPLRSVRTVESSRGAFLVGGSKRGVAVIAFENSGDIQDYPLPTGRTVRGGVNSIAMDATTIYASHSEYGLAAWPVDSPGKAAEMLHENITRPHKTTRAVQIHNGQLLFASGPHVYAGAPAGGELMKYVSSVESPVTCIAAAAKTIFAGTESGSIVCWRIDAPDQPVVLVRKRDAIVNLRLARICGIPHLIYSARDLSVRARVIGQNLETSYESDGASIGVLDAASDLICATDGDGRRVLLWKATTPSRPSRAIDVWRQSEKPVLDLWMRKTLARSA